MKPQLAELVNVILSRIEEHSDSPPSETGLRSWLAGQGYSPRDIDAAMGLVWPRFLDHNFTPERSPGAVRQLSGFEAYKLTNEARDALVRLDMYELIEPFEREMLLDRLGQFEVEVTLEDMDYLLSWVIASTRDVESQQTTYNVFEGQRNTVH